jgi:hypothetical protein
MKENTKENPFIQKIFQYINREETRAQLQNFVIDPLLNHIMERIFPYIVLTCVFLVVLLLLVMTLLGLLIFQLRKGAFVSADSFPPHG